jgi:thymidylate synthase (FAD)
MESKKVSDLYGDGLGYVELLGILGDQFQPAEDARVSTNKGRLGPEKDSALQERLLKDAHSSPFESVIAKFEIQTPLFVLRELDRHRTLDKLGENELVTPEENIRKWFAKSEMSGRYVQMPNEYYHPKEVRAQSKTNKQGGGYELVSPEVQEEFLRRGVYLTNENRDFYSWAVQNGIEKGVARIYNPLNQYTKIRYTGSIKNWCDMLYLRLPNDVLWECRMVAQAIELLLSNTFPAIMDSWRKQVYDTVRLTREEAIELARTMVDAGREEQNKILYEKLTKSK